MGIYSPDWFTYVRVCVCHTYEYAVTSCWNVVGTFVLSHVYMPGANTAECGRMVYSELLGLEVLES